MEPDGSGLSNAEPDDRLLAQAGKGDAAAFSRLMERYHRCVYAYALSLARDPVRAEDVTQEVFLRTWKSVDRVAGGSTLLGWLYATTRHCSSELGRQDRRFQRVPPPAAEIAEFDERKNRLLGILATLPDETRAVISLKYAEGLSCEEIARRLNRPLGTVTSLLSRAYHEVRNRMKTGDHELP